VAEEDAAAFTTAVAQLQQTYNHQTKAEPTSNDSVKFLLQSTWQHAVETFVAGLSGAGTTTASSSSRKRGKKSAIAKQAAASSASASSSSAI
jgi:hypothetical protein